MCTVFTYFKFELRPKTYYFFNENEQCYLTSMHFLPPCEDYPVGLGRQSVPWLPVKKKHGCNLTKFHVENSGVKE